MFGSPHFKTGFEKTAIANAMKNNFNIYREVTGRRHFAEKAIIETSVGGAGVASGVAAHSYSDSKDSKDKKEEQKEPS